MRLLINNIQNDLSCATSSYLEVIALCNMMCGTSYMARSALIVNWSQSVVNVMLQSLDRPGRAAPVVFFMPADVFWGHFAQTFTCRRFLAHCVNSAVWARGPTIPICCALFLL